MFASVKAFLASLIILPILFFIYIKTIFFCLDSQGCGIGENIIIGGITLISILLPLLIFGWLIFDIYTHSKNNIITI